MAVLEDDRVGRPFVFVMTDVTLAVDVIVLIADEVDEGQDDTVKLMTPLTVLEEDGDDVAVKDTEAEREGVEEPVDEVLRVCRVDPLCVELSVLVYGEEGDELVDPLIESIAVDDTDAVAELLPVTVAVDDTLRETVGEMDFERVGDRVEDDESHVVIDGLPDNEFVAEFE